MLDYMECVVVEGFANALMHRSHLQIGSKVYTDMFDNGIEIYLPSGMVNGISLNDKDIFKILSKRRNLVLVDVLVALNIWSAWQWI